MTTPRNTRLHGQTGTAPVPGEFVLYWMQTTLRAEQNPALNHAVECANELGLPAVVYHGLRPDYPWASDRIHQFILESVIDLQRDFAVRGIQYLFWLQPGPARELAARAGAGQEDWSPLIRLARRAALVVTDYFPTFVVPRQVNRLGAALGRRQPAPPVVAVDSCTVVPMAEFSSGFSTARAMRPRLHALLPHYLHLPGNVEPRVRRTIEPGFDPTPRFSAEHLPALLARLPLDHGVPPARSILGGTQAARDRLTRFLARGLPRYADDRSDPIREGTSGLSPYLHFGNISIQEVLLAAREAGPAHQYDRFQDEALVWRELAHNFAFHDPGHTTVDAIPRWARRELDEHRDDPRPALYSVGELESAASGDELWNAAQRSYLEDGWMHNYLRMLWGKAVIEWTRSPEEAFRILVHLNNKYALDGRDPNTYAGIHWIFGKFDRPFYRRPIFGTVRYLSLRSARKKFDWKALSRIPR